MWLVLVFWGGFALAQPRLKCNIENGKKTFPAEKIMFHNHSWRFPVQYHVYKELDKTREHHHEFYSGCNGTRGDNRNQQMHILISF